jgi:transposase
MAGRYIVSLDVHCQETEIVVMTETGRVIRRERRPTTIPPLVEVVMQVRRPRHVVMEEGPLADWLCRNLSEYVDEVVACDPRRNHLIAKDSDKDDPIDAEKLGHLYRGGYIKAVHHAETLDRAIFKDHVGLYHDRVRNRVRQANRIIGQLRRHGVIVRESAFADEVSRAKLLAALPKSAVLREDLKCLWKGYDAAMEQELVLRRQLVALAKKEPQIRRFTALPGVFWIRASTFFVYVDTPWRFRSKSALWKYLGIGLERRHSGSGPEQLHVPRHVHRCLKNAILGAAKSAIVSGNNPFADEYWRYVTDGKLTPRVARRSVARSQAAVMWGMWKNGSVYEPERVGVCSWAQAAAPLSP